MGVRAVPGGAGGSGGAGGRGFLTKVLVGGGFSDPWVVGSVHLKNGIGPSLPRGRGAACGCGARRRSSRQASAGRERGQVMASLARPEMPHSVRSGISLPRACCVPKLARWPGFRRRPLPVPRCP
jgi:hypothetical protein